MEGRFGFRQAAGDAGGLGRAAPRGRWESRTQLPRHRGQPGRASVMGMERTHRGTSCLHLCGSHAAGDTEHLEVTFSHFLEGLLLGLLVKRALSLGLRVVGSKSRFCSM